MVKIMAKRLIGLYRFNKHKWKLNADHDITLDELAALLSARKDHWTSWNYMPVYMANVKIQTYFSTIEKFDREFMALYDKLQIGEYLANKDDLGSHDRKLDNYLSDLSGIPVDIKGYMEHLVTAMEDIATMLNSMSDKEKVFYHRNTYYLRKDIQSILRFMS